MPPLPIRNPWLAALYAALYSWGLSAFAIVSAAVGIGYSLGPANGGYNDWPTFVLFAKHAWFGCGIGLVFQIGPYVRAKQGFTAANNPDVAPPPEQNQPSQLKGNP